MEVDVTRTRGPTLVRRFEGISPRGLASKKQRMWTDKMARKPRGPSAVPDREGVGVSGRGLATLSIAIW